jgi:hypothetical protein
VRYWAIRDPRETTRPENETSKRSVVHYDTTLSLASGVIARDCARIGTNPLATAGTDHNIKDPSRSEGATMGWSGRAFVGPSRTLKWTGRTFAERKATIGRRQNPFAERRATIGRRQNPFAERKATIGRRQNPFAERRATIGRTSMAGDCQVRLCGRAEKEIWKSTSIAAKEIGLLQIVQGEGFAKNGEDFEVEGLRAWLPNSSSRTGFTLLWSNKHKSMRTGDTQGDALGRFVVPFQGGMADRAA